MPSAMRTTLSIADDVMSAAKLIARERGVSVGDVVSDLARQALRRPESTRLRNGLTLLPASRPDAVVTLEVVNRLRDDVP